MCKSVDNLTSKQKRVFDEMYKRIADVELPQQIKIVGALLDHIELSALEQRPYQSFPYAKTTPAIE